jgi:hypothetical protein
MVRGVYDLQKIRIMLGNRITGNFKAKLGQTPDGASEETLAKEDKKILDMLRESYRRITDGIVIEHTDSDMAEEGVVGKLPTPKKFKGDEIISTYTELVLVDQYMTLLADEASHFRKIDNVLKMQPIYTQFLSKVRGIGPAMAGVIISEIDIYKSEYPSSLWKYAGLDVVTIGIYTNDEGKEISIPAYEVEAWCERNSDGVEYLAEGKYPVTLKQVGRSRRDFCLEMRPYVDKEGNDQMRRSITFNPWLKTKLIGVLGTSFLRAGTATVDGKKCGTAKRLALAIEEGFIPPKTSKSKDETVLAEQDVEDVNVDHKVCEYLRMRGHEVVVEPSPYAQHYYDYKFRLEQSPFHKEKTDAHRHNMAIRFAVKRFLVDLYNHWRGLEGLPVAPEFSEGKLGKVHGQAGFIGQ